MFSIESIVRQYKRGLWCIGLLLLMSSLLSVQAQSLPVITPENASKLSQVAQLGYGSLRNAAVSPDGKWLATASSLGVVLYDTKQLSQPPRLLASNHIIASVTFSPDGQWVVGLPEYDITTFGIWHAEADTAAPITLPQAPRQAIFSPNGNWLVIVTGTASLYVYTTGQTTPTHILTMDGDHYIERAYFSPDERIVIAQSATTAFLWDVATGASLSFSSGTRLYAFHPNGEQMATYDRDRRVRVWDITDLENVVNIIAPRLRMSDGYSIQYSPDGEWLVTTGSDGVRVWETTDYTLVDYRSDIPQDYDPIFKPVFSPDSRWIAFLGENEIVIWDTTQQDSTQYFRGRYKPRFVHFTPNSNTLAVFFRSYSSAISNYLAEIRLYDMTSGKQTRHLTQAVPLFPYYFGTTAADDVWLLGVTPEGTQLISLLSDEVLLQIDGHPTQVHDVVFSPDGTLLASTGYDEVRLWDVADQTETAFYERKGVEYGEVAFYNAAALTMTGYSGFEQLDIHTGEQLTFIVPSGITSYAVSSDGQLAAANLDYATLEIWNTTTEKKQIRYVSDMYPGLFSSDNQYLLMYYADMLAVFDIENKQFIAEVNRGYSEGLTAAFTPDSQQFAFFSAETGNIAVWDIAEEKMVRELTLPEPEKTIDIVFSPDGALLAISYRDGVMVLWAVAADKEVARVPADNHSLNEMRFNPAGTMIATAGVDGTVRLWGVGE